MRRFVAITFLLILVGTTAAWTQSHFGGWHMVHIGTRYTWELSSAQGTLVLTSFSNVAEDGDISRIFQCAYWVIATVAALAAAPAWWWWRRGWQQRHGRGFPITPDR